MRSRFALLRRTTRLRITICAAIGLWIAPVARAEEPLAISGPTMGTAYAVKVAQPPSDLTADELRREVESYLAEFDRHVSTYRPDSDLSRFNAHRGTEWFEVHAETASVVQQALLIAEHSDGAFDPTVAPLTRLWGFDRRQGREALPTESELATARALVGFQRVAVRLDPPALKKAVPEIELDVNGLAPGYAVDRLVERLAARGLNQVMVDIGGEIRATGRKGDGSSWRIGVERPAAAAGKQEPRRLQAAVPLDDAAVATSGDYRNVYEIAGERYSHTIDPRTGRPVRHALASVTIIAVDAATADGMATALMVLGPDAGVALADRLGLQAWLLVRDETGGLTARASAAFLRGVGRHLEELPAPGEAAESSPPDPSASSSTPIERAEPVAAAAPVRETSAWTTLLLTLAVFAAAIAGLGAGLLLRGKPLPGSCGGLSGLRDAHGHPLCSTCTTPPEQCEEFRQAAQQGQSSAAGHSEPRPSESA